MPSSRADSLESALLLRSAMKPLIVSRVTRHTLTVVFVVLLAFSPPALAQSQRGLGVSISGGFALSMDFGNERIEPAGGDELTGGFVAPAIGETSRSSRHRVSVYTRGSMCLRPMTPTGDTSVPQDSTHISSITTWWSAKRSDFVRTA
jgi:hypothetical protein